MQQLLSNDLARIEGLKVERDVSLEGLTTFRIGGRARLLLTPLSTGALEEALRVMESAGMPFRILGNGSNLLVSDSGISIAVSLSGLASVKSCNGSLTVQGGLPISKLLRWCLENGYGGIEGLAGIPGTLGGAVFMNAGACGCEIGDFVQEIMLTGPSGSSWVKPAGSTFSYRKANLPSGFVISALRIRITSDRNQTSVKRRALFPRSREDSIRKIRQVMQKRLRSQPLGRPSAGCVFTNPDGISAWSLIAACGFVGFRKGDAQVSEKHANFIVNLGGADFVQVKDLITIIKETVQEQTGILLKEELEIWEDDSIQ